LLFELARQVEKDLIGDVRQRRANAGAGRQLRDQERGLPHDGVDEQMTFHAFARNPPGQ
jgi:hypothetical protein